MQNEYYYVYCNGILGVKTNIRDFKWVYGSVAPSVSEVQFESCLIKFNVCLLPEKELGNVVSFDKKFQCFLWDDECKTIFYRRSLFAGLKIGFNIKIVGNTVNAEVGSKYYRLVKNRTMNLHGIYYLLSDIANMMLLKNNYLTLYASAIHFPPKDRGIVCFSPPNTGKTLTASLLCKNYNYSFVGEDVIITDGCRLFSCPWTSTYRSDKTAMDSSGALGRVRKENDNDICKICDLTDMVVLSLGKEKICTDRDKLLCHVQILNGYLFHYFSTPIVKVLGFFDSEYCRPWDQLAEEMLERIVMKTNCYGIQFENPVAFSRYIHRDITGVTL